MNATKVVLTVLLDTKSYHANEGVQAFSSMNLCGYIVTKPGMFWILPTNIFRTSLLNVGLLLAKCLQTIWQCRCHTRPPLSNVHILNTLFLLRNCSNFSNILIGTSNFEQKKVILQCSTFVTNFACGYSTFLATTTLCAILIAALTTMLPHATTSRVTNKILDPD